MGGMRGREVGLELANIPAQVFVVTFDAPSKTVWSSASATGYEDVSPKERRDYLKKQLCPGGAASSLQRERKGKERADKLLVACFALFCFAL